MQYEFAETQRIIMDVALGQATRDGRAYVVQQIESRDGDALTIRATVLLARIEDAEVGEFVAEIGMTDHEKHLLHNGCTIITGARFQRVSGAAWKRVE